MKLIIPVMLTLLFSVAAMASFNSSMFEAVNCGGGYFSGYIKTLIGFPIYLFFLALGMPLYSVPTLGFLIFIYLMVDENLTKQGVSSNQKTTVFLKYPLIAYLVGCLIYFLLKCL